MRAKNAEIVSLKTDALRQYKDYVDKNVAQRTAFYLERATQNEPRRLALPAKSQPNRPLLEGASGICGYAIQCADDAIARQILIDNMNEEQASGSKAAAPPAGFRDLADLYAPTKGACKIRSVRRRWRARIARNARSCRQGQHQQCCPP